MIIYWKIIPKLEKIFLNIAISLLKKEKSSFLTNCDLPTGQKGWQVQIEECDDQNTHCVRPTEEQ